MVDSSIALSPAVGGGDTLDAELLDGKKREVIVIGGDDLGTEQADVRNAAPAAADYGLVTRNIPSGTQAVSGTVSVVEPVTVDGTVALDAPTLAALETITANQGAAAAVASAWPVKDDYQFSEYLADQAGTGAVLTFTFGSAVNLVVAQSTGALLTARATFDNGATAPSATLGARLEDKSPVYAPLAGVPSIRVFAPVGTTISVWGARRS